MPERPRLARYAWPDGATRGGLIEFQGRPNRRPSRWRKRLLTGLLVVLAAGAGWWAARLAIGPDRDAIPQSDDTITAEVVTAAVGRSINVSVTLQQPVAPLAANSLTGVVTAVQPAGTYPVGELLYAVAGTPVRVVGGAVPFYRDLSRGAVGEDVRQLQAALFELGLTSAAQTGTFSAATETAVRAWQRASGVPVTGVIRLGELIASPTMPAALQLGEEIRLGAVLSGGEDAVLARTGEQRFEIVVSEDQARLIPSDAAVIVRFDDLAWNALIAQTAVDEDGNTVLTLVGVDGGPVCMDECAALPGDAQLTLPGEVIVVPEVSGPAVPSAAVLADPDGGTYVRLANGERVGVTVLGSGQGLAVVEGLLPGQVVLVSGDAVPDPGLPPTGTN